LIQEQNFVGQVALHEARHTWQISLVTGANEATQDGNDRDWIPASPESFDMLALRLKDDHHVSIGGGNPEAHFGGPTINDLVELGGDEQRKIQAERDAICFEGRIVAQDPATCPSLQPALAGMSTYVPLSGSVTMRVNDTSRIAVTVTGETGCTESDPNQHHLAHILHHNSPMQGVVVAFTVTQAPEGALFILQAESTPHGNALPTSCVAVTDETGTAAVDFQPTDTGQYTITVTQWQLKPEGDGQGALQSQFPITVEVTP
jgi:hypothetical protein